MRYCVLEHFLFSLHVIFIKKHMYKCDKRQILYTTILDIYLQTLIHTHNYFKYPTLLIYYHFNHQSFILLKFSTNKFLNFYNFYFVIQIILI